MFIFFLVLFSFVRTTAFDSFVSERIFNSAKRCDSVDYFINKAREWESMYADDYIVYHGESIGTWLSQELLKTIHGSRDPNWLPLRLPQVLSGEISSDSLLHILAHDLQQKGDHLQAFREGGLSASFNLISLQNGESAWWVSCKMPQWDWYASTSLIKEFSFFDLILHQYFKPKYFDLVKELWHSILFLIQRRRRLLNRLEDVQPAFYVKHFPLKLSAKEWNLILEETELQDKEDNDRIEAVILQLKIKKEIGSRYLYASEAFGHPLLRSFEEVYSEVKNRKDLYQVRVALSRAFREPLLSSGIEMKALNPIYQDSVLKRLLPEMLQVMAKYIKK